MGEIRTPVSYCRYCHKQLTSNEEAEEHEKSCKGMVEVKNIQLGIFDGHYSFDVRVDRMGKEWLKDWVNNVFHMVDPDGNVFEVYTMDMTKETEESLKKGLIEYAKKFLTDFVKALQDNISVISCPELEEKK